MPDLNRVSQYDKFCSLKKMVRAEFSFKEQPHLQEQAQITIKSIVLHKHTQKRVV